MDKTLTLGLIGGFTVCVVAASGCPLPGEPAFPDDGDDDWEQPPTTHKIHDDTPRPPAPAPTPGGPVGDRVEDPNHPEPTSSPTSRTSPPPFGPPGGVF
jgi:hypothetical protein